MMRTPALALTLALAAGLTGADALSASPAGAAETRVSETTNTAVAYDPSRREAFELKREIVDEVQAAFGETTVYEDPAELPAVVRADLKPGNVLPETLAEPLPAGLEPLPRLAEDSRWVRAGDHLVEVGPSDTIVMVVYDALR